MATNRSEWKQQGVAYVQEWMQKGLLKEEEEEEIGNTDEKYCFIYLFIWLQFDILLL